MSVVCRKVFWLSGKGALLHRLVPIMFADHMSVSTSQWSEERSMVIHLILTTRAGEEAQLIIDFKNMMVFRNLKMQCWSSFLN